VGDAHRISLDLGTSSHLHTYFGSSERCCPTPNGLCDSLGEAKNERPMGHENLGNVRTQGSPAASPLSGYCGCSSGGCCGRPTVSSSFSAHVLTCSTSPRAADRSRAGGSSPS
jgi:hypothetical protein